MRIACLIFNARIYSAFHIQSLHIVCSGIFVLYRSFATLLREILCAKLIANLLFEREKEILRKKMFNLAEMMQIFLFNGSNDYMQCTTYIHNKSALSLAHVETQFCFDFIAFHQKIIKRH